MKEIFKRRFVIIPDKYAGYEIKVKYPFIPYLFSMEFIYLTFVSKRQAREYLIKTNRV